MIARLTGSNAESARKVERETGISQETLSRWLREDPKRPFFDMDAATGWATRFVAWCKEEHRHSAIRFVTPDERHFGE